MTAAKVELGRHLFYDARLSANGTQSCGSCHQQKRAFTDGRAHALGSTGESHPRGAMSLANVAYASSLTWADAGQRSLEEQMTVPLFGQSPREMDSRGREKEIEDRLEADALYKTLFSEAFPGESAPVNIENVRRAIASFERTILSGNAPYDRLLWRDERDALSPSARRGMTLFFSETLACSKCHADFAFSGPVQWEGGPVRPPRMADNGLGGPFRIPTLRNIAVTAPYMHDGRFTTLGEVIDHYARGGGAESPGKSPLVKGFTLAPGGRDDLTAFLESLTDEELLTSARFADPWKQRGP